MVKKTPKQKTATPGNDRKILQQTVDRHEKTLWFFAFAAAIAKDALDCVPILGTAVSILLLPYFIYLGFRCGSNFSEKFIYISAFFTDSIPIVGFLPVTTGAVFNMYTRTLDAALKAKSKLKKSS
jgi:hypothetical protein